MAVTPLSVAFGDAAALICCEVLSLYERVARLLRHCAPAHTAPAAVYTIRPAGGYLQLYRDETSLYNGPSAAYVVERLLHDLSLTLARHCRQHLLFHAAGVAWGQRGLLLCGESGSGKSTLAACLVAGGFDYLSDEVVAVSPEGVMRGLARPIMLKTGSGFTGQHWPELPGYDSLAHVAGASRLLDPATLRTGSVRASAEPCLLLFPRYAAGQPLQVQPLPAAGAAFRLLQNLLNAGNLGEQSFAGAAQLARRTAAYRLVYGDARTAVEGIRRLVTILKAA